MATNETRLIDLSLGDLKRVIAEAVREQGTQMYEYIDSRLNAECDEAQQEPLKGIKGIAEALHCSSTKARRLKAQGLLEGGYIQIGKTIIVGNPRVLREVAQRNIAAQKKGRSKKLVNYSIINQNNQA